MTNSVNLLSKINESTAFAHPRIVIAAKNNNIPPESEVLHHFSAQILFTSPWTKWNEDTCSATSPRLPFRPTKNTRRWVGLGRDTFLPLSSSCFHHFNNIIIRTPEPDTKRLPFLSFSFNNKNLRPFISPVRHYPPPPLIPPLFFFFLCSLYE